MTAPPEASTAPPAIVRGRPAATTPGPFGRWWRRWLGRVLVAAALLWLIFTVVHLVVGGRFWWWLPVELLPPIAFLAVPVSVATVAAACRRTRRTVGLLCAAALLAGSGLTGINLPGPLRRPAPVPVDALRVVAWNTEYWHQQGRAGEFYDLLRAQRADVYLLQEYLHDVDGEMTRVDDLDRLRRELPGYHVAVVGELLTLSRHPIVAWTPLRAEGLPASPIAFTDFWRYQVLRTDLLVDGQVLSAYNVHLPVPLWAGGPAAFSPEFRAAIREQHARRVPQLRALAADVAGNDNPVLVAGDMNTSPAMGQARWFPPDLHDAARVNRSIYPASWPAGGPSPALWRLDWALVDDRVSVHTYDLRDPAGQSDHRLQFLSISL